MDSSLKYFKGIWDLSSKYMEEEWYLKFGILFGFAFC